MKDFTNNLAYQLLGCSLLDITQSYWAVKLKQNEWLCEARVHTDILTGQERNFGWYEDIVSSGESEHITELWLFCPPSHYSPFGNTARLPITEPYTAFEFKRAHVSSDFVSSWKTPSAHIIGKVTDKMIGSCLCFIWDEFYQILCQPFETSIYHFHSWRSGIPDLGALAYEKLGIRL